MRSFIAIELPELAKSALAGLQQDLKKSGADIRWVKPDNIHLTLKFLGEVGEELVHDVGESIKGTCNNFTAFTLELKGTGVFPDMKSPRVLWVGVTYSAEVLALQAGIDEGMSFLGFEKEKRKFTPHLTLGRIRSSRGRADLLDRIGSHKDSEYGVIEVKSVSLMRSDLSPSGARHSTLAEHQLKERGKDVMADGAAGEDAQR